MNALLTDQPSKIHDGGSQFIVLFSNGRINLREYFVSLLTRRKLMFTGICIVPLSGINVIRCNAGLNSCHLLDNHSLVQSIITRMININRAPDQYDR